MSLLSLLNTFFPDIDATQHISRITYPSSMPPCLAPTQLQTSTSHAPWIDIFPAAAMRDNLIQAEGTFDQHDLCSDMLGGLFHGFDEKDYRGFFSWGEPWDVRGWEISTGFVDKWGWLLKGCLEFVEATNKWRAMRGEEPLVVAV